MSCTDNSARQSLEQLFTGELSEDGLVSLRAHAQTCEHCHGQYDRITRAAAQLEKSRTGLPADRMSFLEQRVLARAAQSDGSAVAAAKQAEPSLWTRFRFWMAPAAGLAIAGVLVAVVQPRSTAPGTTAATGAPAASGAAHPEWQARGGAAANPSSAFGVRAFCVSREQPPKVQGEAGPGGSLPCAPGMAVQFTYTAPRPARLTIAAPTTGGDWLTFLPATDPQAQVKAGSDVPLTFSTVVSKDWLSAPLEVQARFEDPETGKILAESQVQLIPLNPLPGRGEGKREGRILSGP